MSLRDVARGLAAAVGASDLLFNESAELDALKVRAQKADKQSRDLIVKRPRLQSKIHAKLDEYMRDADAAVQARDVRRLERVVVRVEMLRDTISERVSPSHPIVPDDM